MTRSPILLSTEAGKRTTEKAVEAVAAVEQALYDTLGPTPVVVALGVLRIVEHNLIDAHKTS